MATGPIAQLWELAQQFKLEIITIEDLIRYRRRMEKLVYRVADCEFPTRYGPGRLIGYQVKYENQEPIAVVMGDPANAGSLWCGSIPPVSRAIFWPHFAATAATNCTSPWR